MSDIILSGAIRTNVATLRQTAQLIAAVQNRLATGKKVNSALDNPTAFFAAQELSSRAVSLGTVLDGISTGTKTLEAANAALTALTNLVNSAESVANSALASARTTASNSGTVAALTGTSSFLVASGNTITVNDGTVTATITSTGSVTVQQILDGVNNTASLKVKASLTADGRILLEATGTNSIVIGGTSSPAEKAQFGLTAGTTTGGSLNSSRSSLAAQFDTLRGQIDALATDAGFDGVNLLNGGTLKINLNETGSSSLSVTGVTFNSAGLGIVASTNTWQTDKDINDAIAKLKTALSTLQTQTSVFASNQSLVDARDDFTNSMIDTLNTAADNLVSADTNEEAAVLLALQTRQELSMTALSIAASNDQAILRLFR
jgi:flagellin